MDAEAINIESQVNFKRNKSTSISLISITAASELRQRIQKAQKKEWISTVVLPSSLVAYSILKEIKVGEPYLFKYQTEVLNLTTKQITSEIYPFTPYAYMISLIPIFLLTDVLLYKPTMFMELIGQIAFRATLVFGHSVPSQCAGQVFYGIASASEIAFFSYIYAILEKDQYQKLTGWTRAGTMFGRTCGYLFSQFLILTHLGNLTNLNVTALILPCIVFFVCIFLPRVHWKAMVGRILEVRGTVIKPPKLPQHLPKSYSRYVLYRVRKLKSDFIRIYRVGYIRKWSLWWALTTMLSLQIALFAQTLWGEVQKNDKNPLNGFAEASYTLVAALAILAMNTVPFDWDKWGELTLVLISSVDAGVLFLFSSTNSIYVMYGCYIAYRSLYQVMITIAQWNIAKKMVCESYGLVFGTNSFIALIMQSILSLIVTDHRGLGLNVRQQYLIYASMHLVISIVFLGSVALSLFQYFLGAKNSKIATSTVKHKNELEISETVLKADILKNGYHK